jgi:hypothetical protein
VPGAAGGGAPCLLGDSWVATYNECGWRANCTARRRTSRPPRGHGGQRGTIRGNVNGGGVGAAERVGLNQMRLPVCLSMRASSGTGVVSCRVLSCPVVLTRVLVLANNAYRETGTPSTMPAMWTMSKTGLDWLRACRCLVHLSDPPGRPGRPGLPGRPGCYGIGT